VARGIEGLAHAAVRAAVAVVLPSGRARSGLRVAPDERKSLVLDLRRSVLVWAALCAGVSCASPSPVTDGGADGAADAGIADGPVVEAGGSDAVSPSDGGLREVTVMPAPNPRTIEPGVVREVIRVRVSPPRPNAVEGRAPVATPDALNFVQVVRYHAPDVPTERARAVIVAVPGFLGGAGSFDGLARAVVKRSVREGQPVEYWAVDRRSNLLEDLAGMEAAEAMGDPELARAYYVQRSLAVNGRAFAGYLGASSASLAYMSEWGLGMLVGDLRAVIERVPMSRSRVILMGHSLGASIVEAYAAWQFDDRVRGYDTIAGLSLVDGVAGGTSVTEAQYFNGGAPAPGGFGMAQGVTALRAGGPYFVALPLLGVQAVVLAEIVARRVLAAPDAVVTDGRRDELLRTLLSVDVLPPMSNAAAFGFAFDGDSCGLSFAAMNVGTPIGPTRSAMSVLGPRITVPASETITYRWTDANESDPPEHTPLRAAALGWAATPTNFAEWYFPSRLTLDVSALGDLRLSEGSFAWREGIRAAHGGAVDVPVLAIGTALVPDRARFDAMRARLSDTVGAGRPSAGAARTDERAYRVLMLPEMTHIDPIMAPEGGRRPNPVPAAVLDFARANTVALP
jgi:hypothetical protein